MIFVACILFEKIEENRRLEITRMVIYRCAGLLWTTLNANFGFHQIWREPRIVEKQAIYHLKALIVDILNPEDWGRGVIISLPQPLFVKISLFRRRGRGKLLKLPRLCPSGLLLSTIRGFK